ncbi:MAG: hypothetical protein LUH14_06015 [Clostridiaceae bacterium]|nr:hypothetical protein [Clostridiaceae bacterium]
MNNKVKIICCYYGKFPEYFNLWLWTCGNNPKFDFMLVTDEQVENAPDNVFVYNISFPDLKDKISKCLGKKIKLEKPYKLCDYRPVYGLAFADELKGYDFWGQCDLDMLWGNLKAGITDEILENYDIVGQRGALILYRNCERINHLYRLDGGVFSSDYVFSHTESCGFDEMTGMNRISEKHGISRYKDLHIADAIRENTRLNIRGTEKCKEFFCMKDGKLFRVYEDNKRGLMADEYLYLHMSGKSPAVHIT